MDEYEPNERTSEQDWCRALRQPCVMVDGVVVSQPSSTAICGLLFLGYLYYGVRTIWENRRRGADWAWIDSHLAEYRSPTKAAESIRDGAALEDATKERCRTLYGVSLVANAVVLVLATASYQTFTYQLNCASRDGPCIQSPDHDAPASERAKYRPDHNGCAIAYLVLQTFAVYALVLADTYRAHRTFVRSSAAIGVAALVFFACWIAAYDAHGQADFFSASILATLPGLAIQFYLSYVVKYEIRLVFVVLINVVALAAFQCWGAFVNEEALYSRTGVWLHANDVLHILLLPLPPALHYAGCKAVDAPPGSSYITEERYVDLITRTASALKKEPRALRLFRAKVKKQDIPLNVVAPEREDHSSHRIEMSS